MSTEGADTLPDDDGQVEQSQSDEIDVEARRATLRAAYTPEPYTGARESEVAETAAVEDEPPADPPQRFAQITQEQFDALAAKAAEIDAIKAEQAKGFGSIGGTMRSFGQKLAEMSNPTAAPVFDLTDEEIETIKEDFPALAAGMAKLKGARPATVDHDALLAKVREQMAPDLAKAEAEAEVRAYRRMSTKLLTDVHPDYREVTAKPEFAAFVRAQGDEFGRRLAQASDDWDFSTIGKAVSAFKAAEQKAANAKSTRQARLDAGVNPRGSAPLGQPAMTQQQNLRETFKKYAHGSG